MENRQIKLIYSTFPSRKECRKASLVMIGEGLAACANFWEIESCYSWKGKIEEGKEFALILKVLPGRLGSCCKKLKEIHPYEAPAIFEIPAGCFDQGYFKWMESSLSLSKEGRK